MRPPPARIWPQLNSCGVVSASGHISSVCAPARFFCAPFCCVPFVTTFICLSPCMGLVCREEGGGEGGGTQPWGNGAGVGQGAEGIRGEGGGGGAQDAGEELARAPLPTRSLSPRIHTHTPPHHHHPTHNSLKGCGRGGGGTAWGRGTGAGKLHLPVRSQSRGACVRLTIRAYGRACLRPSVGLRASQLSH